MDEQPILTRPLSTKEKLLQEKFAQNIANQNDLMDKIGQQLITVELAIPGLFVTIIRSGNLSRENLMSNPVFWFTCNCWCFALILALLCLIPRKWKVDPQIMRQDPSKKSDVLGIEDFFHKTAQYKRNLIISSCMLFFCGIISAFFTMV